MTVYSGQFFYLGNYAAADTDEADFDNENTTALLGVSTLPDLVTIDLDDTDDNNVIEDDDVDGSPDTVGYDLGGGYQTNVLDSSSIYNAIITYGDGSTANVQLVVMQMANGDVFVNDLTQGDLDDQAVYQINLTSEASSNYSGISPGTFVTGASTAICFAAGTMIETVNGVIAIEQLRPGQLLPTRSGAVLPIHWITRRHHTNPGCHAPICITANALGPGIPAQDLRLSPQHRILVSSPIVQRMCKCDAVLVPAKSLLEMPGVNQADKTCAIDYFHILLSSHQIIRANGLCAETLYLGTEARKTLPKFLCTGSSYPVAAAPFITVSRSRRLIQRHLKNNKPLWCQNAARPITDKYKSAHLQRYLKPGGTILCNDYAHQSAN